MAIILAGNWKHPGPGGRRNKYRNTRVKTEDGNFASKGEWRRWVYLKGQQDRGRISDLKKQIRFSLDIGDHHICDYIADFSYIRGGKYVIEDFKGMITDVFTLKAKMVKAIHGIDIKIIKKPEDPIDA